MAKAIKFRAKRKLEFVNKCIMCGATISLSKAICNTCNNRRIRSLRKIRR